MKIYLPTLTSVMYVCTYILETVLGNLPIFKVMEEAFSICVSLDQKIDTILSGSSVSIPELLSLYDEVYLKNER